MNKKLLLVSTIFSSILTYRDTVSAKTVNMIGDVDFSKPDRNFQDSSGKYTSFQNGNDIIVTSSGAMSIPGGVEPIINSITVNNPVNNIKLYILLLTLVYLFLQLVQLLVQIALEIF